ncbi:MFS transporter [Facilibium subflavum]|uniref:MFS transporter n=1 Tax=Facilibium subflavum TaxID=2219058 RepID=UPI000E659C47|nr:MFS transporter [Facilibium subflavum]
MHIQGKKKGILVSTILFITAGLILAYPQSLMDTYLPVLPYLDNALNTSDMLVQYTVACFLLGNALSQLASGVLSDYFGRIKILLLGLVIAILGSILCYIGYNIIFMLIGRAIQGVGSGMAAILMRVIIADSFPGKSFSKVYSFLVAFSILMIAVGPVIASHLMQYYGWESVMSFMLGYAIIIGLLVVTSIIAVSCTLPQAKLIKKRPRQLWAILLNKQFLMTTLVMFFIYGVMASILLSYPYIFIQVYHMQVSDFGWVIALVVLCMLAGAILNNLLLRRFSSIAVTKAALIIMFISMVGVLLS